MESFEELFSLQSLDEAFYQCITHNHWKQSTHNYWVNLLPNNIKLHEELMSGAYRVGEKYDFIISERGKRRLIQAPLLIDRIVQKILCRKVLIPQLSPYLIYDNYASLEDRGISLARKRTEIALRNWISVHGNSGYVTTIDIHNFFGSIRHDILKQMIHEKIIADQKTVDLIDYSIDTSEDNGVGLNLGSEVPQISAVFYPYRLDNWFKIVERVPSYGRYMDDIKYLTEDTNRAKYLIDGAVDILDGLGLQINEKKTQIVKLSHGFTYLQTKYNIDNGHLITRPTHDKIARERQKLKRYRNLVDEGRATPYEVYLWYNGWKRSLLKDYNSCWNTLQNMDVTFNELFPVIEKPKKMTRSQMIYNIFKEAEYEDLRYGWK